MGRLLWSGLPNLGIGPSPRRPYFLCHFHRIIFSTSAISTVNARLGQQAVTLSPGGKSKFGRTPIRVRSGQEKTTQTSQINTQRSGPLPHVASPRRWRAGPHGRACRITAIGPTGNGAAQNQRRGDCKSMRAMFYCRPGTEKKEKSPPPPNPPRRERGENTRPTKHHPHRRRIYRSRLLLDGQARESMFCLLTCRQEKRDAARKMCWATPGFDVRTAVVECLIRATRFTPRRDGLALARSPAVLLPAGVSPATGVAFNDPEGGPIMAPTRSARRNSGASCAAAERAFVIDHIAVLCNPPPDV